MLNRKLLSGLILISIFVCSFLYAGASSFLPGPDKNWYINLEDAMKKAKKENKKIYVLSTGSDWCGWCIRLKNDVFSQKEFKSFARKNLVLVYLDSPRRKPMPAEQRQYNNETKRKLGFGGGVPSAKILDADGKVITNIGGYRKLPAYMAALKQYGTASGERNADKEDKEDKEKELLPSNTAGRNTANTEEAGNSVNINILAWGTSPDAVDNSYSFRPVRLSCGEKLYFKLSSGALSSGSRIKVRAGRLSGVSLPFSGKGEILVFLHSRRVVKCTKLEFYHIASDGTEKLVKTIPCDIQWER